MTYNLITCEQSENMVQLATCLSLLGTTGGTPDSTCVSNDSGVKHEEAEDEEAEYERHGIAVMTVGKKKENIELL